MLTSKQRAQLRGMASTMQSILTVGKGGMSPELYKQAADALLKEYPEYIAVETQMSDAISMAVSSYYRNLKKLEESSR